MNQNKIEVIMRQVKELVIQCNTILCDNAIMDELAEKKYGFSLVKKNYVKSPLGWFFAVRYKDPNGKWLDGCRCLNTTDREKAVLSAIQNKDLFLPDMLKKRDERKKIDSGKAFYKMLNDYYQKDSVYLADDSVNGKRKLDAELRRQSIGNLKNYIIPFLKLNKITSIEGITREIYSNLKIYLQNQISNTTEKALSPKTMNNILQSLMRILENHFRNEKIPKLPYIKGTALFPKSITNENQAGLLPIELLSGIIENYIFDLYRNEEKLMLEDILWIIGLTTGMRDSEIARVKRNDIQPLPESHAFILKVWNNKTDFYNKTAEERYRKIPLNTEVVKLLKHYISNKELENKKLLEKESLTRETNILKIKEKIKTMTDTIERLEKTKIFEDPDKNKIEIEKRKKSLENSLFYAEKKLKVLESNRDWRILPDDYIFGEPKTDNETGDIDGIIHARKFQKSIKNLYKKIKFKEYFLKLNVKKAYEIDDAEIEKEMIEKKIKFYSLRHTFQTIMALYKHGDISINRGDSLLDYFAGHKSGNSVRENYIHINSVNDKDFMNNYGIHILKMIEKFLMMAETGETAEELKKLFNTELEKAIEKKQTKNIDDFYFSF